MHARRQKGGVPQEAKIGCTAFVTSRKYSLRPWGGALQKRVTSRAAAEKNPKKPLNTRYVPHWCAKTTGRNEYF